MEDDLLEACERGDLETVRRLSSQANIRDVKYSDGEGPLHKAAELVTDTNNSTHNVTREREGGRNCSTLQSVV